MADLIEKILSIEGGALAITRDSATKLVNNLVQNGEVKPEEAQPLIDELVAQGEAERDALREDLAAQVTTLQNTTKSIQAMLNTNIKEASERAIHELVLLGEQITNVQDRLHEAEKQVGENTWQILEQAQKQLSKAQIQSVQTTEMTRSGAIEEAKHSVKALDRTLNKTNHILLTYSGTLALTRDKVTAVVNDLVRKGEVKREDTQALIDELGVRGKEARANLLKALDTQVIALSTIAKAIQSNLSTGTKEAVEKTYQELDTLGEQLTGVRDRVSEAEKQVEESTRQTLEQAREQPKPTWSRQLKKSTPGLSRRCSAAWKRYIWRWTKPGTFFGMTSSESIRILADYHPSIVPGMKEMKG
jgi:polyhydroxyalkanoate synthesis regulator phasin